MCMLGHIQATCVAMKLALELNQMKINYYLGPSLTTQIAIQRTVFACIFI